jgi:penicillin amidase
VAAAGLSAPVEIVDDPYGVPHIRARSIPDAFFGQGYVVARDRLFQLDLAHRRELGRLAEAFGPDFAAHDAAARLFLFRGDLDAELARGAGASRRLRPRLCGRDQRPHRRGPGRSRLAAAGIFDPRRPPSEMGRARDWCSRAGGSFSVDDEVRRARLAASGAARARTR